MSAAAAVKRLCDARDTGTKLSARSVDLITLESEAARNAYVNEMKDILYTQSTLITCMDTLKKDSEDNDAITLLVVGTESGTHKTQIFLTPQLLWVLIDRVSVLTCVLPSL